jgi:hypothetical protein
VAGLVDGEDHGELPVLGHERHLLDQGGSVGKTDGPSRFLLAWGIAGWWL